MKSLQVDVDLLIDLGNSRVKWAMKRGQEWVVGPAIPVAGLTDWGITLADEERPQRVLISNSAGSAAEASIITWCESELGVTPKIIRSEPRGFGVHNTYKNPSELGADRWLAMIAARHDSSVPAVVVDCGTAVTVDALDGAGHFLGGVIIPSDQTMCRNLLAQVTHLHADAIAGSNVFNLSTGSAVANGSLMAVIGGIDRTVETFFEHMGQDTRVVLTGGNAARIAPLLRCRCSEHPNLVLDGLRIVAGHVT